jgi:hypothetical protein
MSALVFVVLYNNIVKSERKKRCSSIAMEKNKHDEKEKNLERKWTPYKLSRTLINHSLVFFSVYST